MATTITTGSATATERERRHWRRLYDALLNCTSLFCRWSYRALERGRAAVGLEQAAERERVAHSLLLASMRAEFYALARRARLNLDETTLDEMLDGMVGLCGRLWRLERAQGGQIGAAVQDMERARGQATAANRLLEPALGQHVELQWVE